MNEPDYSARAAYATLEIVKNYAKFTGKRDPGIKPDIEIFDKTGKLAMIGEVKSPDHDIVADIDKQIAPFAERAFNNKAILFLAFCEIDLEKALPKMHSISLFDKLNEQHLLQVYKYAAKCEKNKTLQKVEF